MAQAELSSAVLADSPAAYWKLDEASGLPQDSSGNGLHMTASAGTPVYQYEAPFTGGNSIRFNRVTTPTVDAKFTRNVVVTATSNVAFEAWVRCVTPDPGTSTAYFQNGATGTRFSVVLADSTLTISPGFTANGWTTESWTHIAWSFDGSALRFYVNGDLWQTQADAGFSTPTGSTILGYESDANRTAAVALSNVSVYNTLLSSARVRAHYEAAIDWHARPLENQAMSGLALA